MQGFQLICLLKLVKKKTELGKVFHYDLFGKRDLKYDFLSGNLLKDVAFQELKPNEPNYFYTKK